MDAQKEYELTRSESRSGYAISETELKHLDSVLSPLLLKGQSVHHISQTHADSIMCSEKTLYTYIHNNLLSARNIDLPRKVRLRPRRLKSVTIKVDKSCRIGRTWKDYCGYMTLHPDTPVVQIDPVAGMKVGGGDLLTIPFVNSSSMLAFLRDSNDSQSVIDIFDRLYLELRPDIFQDPPLLSWLITAVNSPPPPGLNLTIRETAGRACSTVTRLPSIRKGQRRTTMNLYGASSQKVWIWHFIHRNRFR